MKKSPAFILAIPLPIFLNLFLSIFSGTIAQGANSQSYTWKNVAIKGGGLVNSVIFHPTEQNLLYARTDVGGAYRWNESEQSWIPLNDDIGGIDNEFNLQGVLSLALDPNDPDQLYLASGQYISSWSRNAVFRSSDRGATWERTDVSFRIGGNSYGRTTGERMQVDPNKGNILFLGTHIDGLQKSEDSGQTWSKVTSFPTNGITLLFFDATSATSGNPTPVIYAFGANINPAGGDPYPATNGRLYKSTDAGATWLAVSGQPTGLVAHHNHLTDTGIVYLSYCDGLGPWGISSGAVYRYDTINGTWTNISPAAGDGGYGGISASHANPDHIVVTSLNRWSSGNNIWRSLNGGATWTALFNKSTWDTTSAPYAARNHPHWMGDLKIDPSNDGRAFFTTGYGIFSTEQLKNIDSGNNITWEFTNDGLEETVPNDLVSPPSGPQLISVIGDYSGFRHADLDQSPALGYHSPPHGSNDHLSIAELDPDVVVRTFNDGIRASYSINGASTWTDFPDSPAEAKRVFVDNNNRIPILTGKVIVTADGRTFIWQPEQARPYYSTDEGNTWHQCSGLQESLVSSSSAFNNMVSDRANPNKVYLYDPSVGNFYRSLDAGVTFALTAATGFPSGSTKLRAVPGKEGHLWMRTSSGFFRSTDSGDSFTYVSGAPVVHKFGFGKAAENQNYPAIFIWGWVDGATGFFRSDDEGATWIRINDDLHQFGRINVLTGDPRVHGRIYLGTSGRGIIYGDSAGDIIEEEEPTGDEVMVRKIYDDVLLAGWGWESSWGSNISLTHSNYVYEGDYSIKVDITGGWGALWLDYQDGMNLSSFDSMRFYINGGSAGNQSVIFRGITRDAQGNDTFHDGYPITMKANTWEEYTIPLNSLSIENAPRYVGLQFQFLQATALPPFYVDLMGFTASVDPLEITTPSQLVAGKLNQPYSTSLNASGGYGSHAWSLTSGSLPSGISLLPDGTISGSPQAVGTFQFITAVTDESDNSEALPFTLTIDNLTYTEWRESIFDAGQLADPLVSGPLSDPDFDGVANYLEWYFNRNGMINESGNALIASLILNQDQEEFFELICQKRKGIAVQNRAVQISVDLINWSDLAGESVSWQESDDGNGQTETLTARILTPIDQLNGNFLKLAILVP